MKTRHVAGLITLLGAAPAGATTDASVETPVEFRADAARTCVVVGADGPGTTDAPTVLQFPLPLEAAGIEGLTYHAWLRVEFEGELDSVVRLRGEQMGARFAGAAFWSGFGEHFRLPVPDECPEDAPECDLPRVAVLAPLFSFAPSDTHQIELVRFEGAPEPLREVCFFVMPEPAPEAPARDMGVPVPEGEPFDTGWDAALPPSGGERRDGDAVDAGAAAEPAHEGEAESGSETPSDADGEKTGCSATGGRGVSLWTGLLLLPLARRRRRH